MKIKALVLSLLAMTGLALGQGQFGGGGSGSGSGGGGNTTSTALVAGEPVEGAGTNSIVPSPYYVDATASTYLSTAGGDACLAINRAVVAAINAGISKVIAPFTGFWSCNTNIWQVSGGTSPGSAILEIEFGATGKNASGVTAFIMSVAQYTPYIGGYIHAAQAATSGLTQGMLFVLCGPELAPAGIYSGGICSFTDGAGNSRTVNAPSTTNVTFNIPHGPFPAGNYIFAIGLQGEGISSDAFPQGMGWNRDGGTLNWSGIAVSCGGNLNCFDMYDLNGDENTKLRDFRVSGPDNTLAGGTGSPWAGVFFDRVECCTNQVGKGWARISIEHLNMAGLGLITNHNYNAYGIVLLGMDLTFVNTGAGSCTGTLKMWPTSVNSSGVLTGVQVDPNSNGGGTCVTPTFTVYGAAPCWNSATGNIAGGTVTGCGTNNPAGNFGLNTSATLTAVVFNGYLIGATISGATGYQPSFITGGTELNWIDIAGGTGGSLNMEEGVYVDGVGKQTVGNIHCININLACVDYGEFNLTAGGVIGPVDAPSAGTGVGLGPGIDGNQNILGVFRQSGIMLTDNHHLPPLTLNATNYPNGLPGYNPSGLFVPGAVGNFGGGYNTNAGSTSTLGFTSNLIKMYGITVPYPVPLNNITYLTGATVDNSNDTWNFALCQGSNASYCMPIVDTGAVAGTTAMAAANTITHLNWANAYNGWAVGDTIPAGRYYVLVSCTTVGGTICGLGTAILQGSTGSGAGSMTTWFTPNTSSATSANAGLYSSSGFAFPIATPAGNSNIQGTIPWFVFN
jgi:hypothetical protein